MIHETWQPINLINSLESLTVERSKSRYVVEFKTNICHLITHKSATFYRRRTLKYFKEKSYLNVFYLKRIPYSTHINIKRATGRKLC